MEHNFAQSQLCNFFWYIIAQYYVKLFMVVHTSQKSVLLEKWSVAKILISNGGSTVISSSQWRRGKTPITARANHSKFCAFHPDYDLWNPCYSYPGVVRFSDSLALGRASGLGNLTGFLRVVKNLLGSPQQKFYPLLPSESAKKRPFSDSRHFLAFQAFLEP